MVIKRREPTKLIGNEKFKNTDDKNFSVKDFWQFGFSNLNSNILRGTLAEYLVETALKDVNEIDVRNPWGDYDVLSLTDKKIEVKCCSYLQDWDQKKLSNIVFSGLKAKPLYWNEAVKNQKDLYKDKDYKADVYVLALLNHKEADTLDILDLNQWAFFVLSKNKIKEITRNGESVSLSKLNKNNIKPIGYSDIASAIKACK